MQKVEKSICHLSPSFKSQAQNPKQIQNSNLRNSKQKQMTNANFPTFQLYIQ